MTYRLSRWLFLRLLALVYLVAFVSLWVQIDGLIGSGGILPLGDYLGPLHERLASEAYRLLPTLTWFSSSDAFLHVLCACGVGLSLLLIVGVAPTPVLLALWAVYLSLQLAGQVFLSFQWDILLLESGFCAVFFAPAEWRPRLPWNATAPSRAGRWLLWSLLVKLMVLSGAVKLICLDPTWWSLTALDYHYFTQPLPLRTSWYAHHLPGWFQKLSVLVMFAVEIGVPFLIWGPRRLRLAACAALIGFQLLIAATGNYGFFNLLTTVLCVPLLDDAFLGRFLPAGRRGGGPARKKGWRRLPGRVVRLALVGCLLLLSGLSFVREVVRTEPRSGIDGPFGLALDLGRSHVLSWGEPLLRAVDPFNTVNGYGLFRGMTTTRPEIVIEHSADGRSWQEYEFRYKAGDVTRPPRRAAPHMPRLDWQMWFAALNPQGNFVWLERLVLRLLEGAPAVQALLERVPPGSPPPAYVRLVLYSYEFSEPAERKAGGAWWRRQRQGELTRPLSLEQLRRD